jgi:hypothetical protein
VDVELELCEEEDEVTDDELEDEDDVEELLEAEDVGGWLEVVEVTVEAELLEDDEVVVDFVVLLRVAK